MFATLFSSKKNHKADKKSKKLQKSSFLALERLLAELGIKFAKSDTDPKDTVQERKVKANTYTGHSPAELENIARNQLAYAQLFKEKMQRTPLGKKDTKVTLFSR